MELPPLVMTPEQKADFEALARAHGIQDRQLRRLVSDERYESMETEWFCRGYLAGLAAQRLPSA